MPTVVRRLATVSREGMTELRALHAFLQPLHQGVGVRAVGSARHLTSRPAEAADKPGTFTHLRWSGDSLARQVRAEFREAPWRLEGGG